MSSNPEKLERLKQPKSMSMYASQGDMISDLLIDRSLASAEIDRLQRENAALKIDASNHAADAETVRREREVERRRAEAAEAEVNRLQTELALSKPLYSRRQIEARVKLLESALKPFAGEAENWSDSVPDDHKTLCTEPGSSTAHPGSEAYFTVGDLRRARTALASTGGEHHAE